MKKQEAILIYSTVPDQAAGEKIIKALLEDKLIACGNLLSPGLSLFRWKGQAQKASESALILKTQKGLYQRAEREILRLHPYDCPCVLAFEASLGHAPFIEWIFQETGGAAGAGASCGPKGPKKGGANER